MPLENYRRHTVILGAGIAGLSAALNASKAGHQVTVIEKENAIGGLCNSFRDDGFLFEKGPHLLHPSSEKTLPTFHRLCHEFKGTIRKIEKKTLINFNNAYFRHPLQLLDSLSKLPPREFLRCSLSFIDSFIRLHFGIPKHNDNNFAGFVANRFGDQFYHIFFAPYTYRSWGINPTELSASLANIRVPIIRLRKLFFENLINPFLRTRNDFELQHTPERSLWNLEGGGIQLLVNSLNDQLLRKGNVNIVLNSAIHKITVFQNGKYMVDYFRANSHHSVECSQLITTIKPSDFVKLVYPKPDAEILRKISALKFRGLLFVFLKICKDRVFHTGAQWVYFADPALVFTRVTEFKNIDPSFAMPGYTGLCLECPTFPDDHIWNMSEEQLIAACIEGLAKYRLINKQQVIPSRILRTDMAYPIYDLDWKENRKALLDFYDSLGVKGIGRAGSFFYANIDQVYHQGLHLELG